MCDATATAAATAELRMEEPVRAALCREKLPDAITRGDHWNVSDVLIEIGSSGLGDVRESDAEVPDYSDPEYMPPTAVCECP